MAEEIDALVEGGEASAGPPLGPALGPLGVNVGEVVSRINEETSGYQGMEVPVKVIVDEDSGEFDIEVGSPPTTALIKNKLGIEKGGGAPEDTPVGDLSVEQASEIADSKRSDLLAKNLKKATKEVVGSCVSMGVHVEGKTPEEVIQEIEEGKYDDQLEGDE